MTYVWSAGPWRTGPEVSLDGARGKKLTVRRGTGGGSSELGFELGGRDRAAAVINEGEWDAWLFHNGEPLWRARIGPSQESGSATKQSLQMTALDYRDLLARRLLVGPTVQWTNADPADASWQVLTEEQSRPGSHLGIVRGTTRKGGVVATTVKAEPGQPVRQTLDTLAGLDDGADWDLTPTYTDSTPGFRYDWWAPTRDQINGAVIVKLGHAAVSYTRAVEFGAYANSVRVTGQAPEGGGDAPAPLRLDATDMTSRPEGRFDIAESTEQSTTAALQARAKALLTERQVVPVTYSCVLRRGWWQGKRHLWVGDTVRWICRIEYEDDGGLYLFRDVDVVLPVEEMGLEFDRAPSADEVEQHREYGLDLDPTAPKVTLTLGAPRIDAIRSIARRLGNLERR